MKDTISRTCNIRMSLVVVEVGHRHVGVQCTVLPLFLFDTPFHLEAGSYSSHFSSDNAVAGIIKEKRTFSLLQWKMDGWKRKFQAFCGGDGGGLDMVRFP